MKKSPALLAVLPLGLLLASCGSAPGQGGATTRVVASFYPFAYLAKQVGGSHVTVTNLTSPGTEPHDLELRPKQVAGVQDATLVVYEKHFQPAVDAAVDRARRSSADTIDVADVVTLKSVQKGGEQNASNTDPHAWLDPVNMISVTAAIATKLSAIDPKHSTQYAANAARLTVELKALDSEFAANLKTCRTRTIVTSHAAFQYLAARYGLVQVPIAGIDPANEPSPSQLADIIALVRKERFTTIFTEELVSPAIARTIADETGTVTATLDPIEGLSDKTHGETYVTLMRKNLANIQKANSCS